jgi:hypothetical protein
MSDGSQLEMVDGSLITIKPATLVLDEGEIIKHRILDLEEDEVDEEAGYRVCVCVCVCVCVTHTHSLSRCIHTHTHTVVLFIRYVAAVI